MYLASLLSGMRLSRGNWTPVKRPPASPVGLHTIQLLCTDVQIDR